MASETRKDGGPAFPQMKLAGDYVMEGLSLRDYFAAKAMQSQLVFEGMEGCDKDHITAMAYELADAMLKAREQ